MSISKQAVKMFGLKSSANLIPKRVVMQNRDEVFYMNKDGLKTLTRAEQVTTGEQAGEPLTGVYRLRHKMFKRDHPTKKRGKWVEVVTHVRGWKLARKYALKYNAELIRVS